jgi:hypothetical protein
MSDTQGKGFQGSKRWNDLTIEQTISQQKNISSELILLDPNTSPIKTIVAGYDKNNEILHIFKAIY